jgi:hypothetical protein
LPWSSLSLGRPALRHFIEPDTSFHLLKQWSLNSFLSYLLLVV